MYRDLRWVSAAELFSRISTFVTIPILTNSLLPARYGLYRGVLVAVGLLLIFRSLPNIGYLLQKRLPEVDGTISRGSLVSAGLIVQLVAIAIGIALLAIVTISGTLSILSPELQKLAEEYFYLITALVLTQGLSQGLIPTIKGLDKFKLYSIVRILRENVILIAVLGLFVTGHATVPLVLSAYIVAEGAVILTAGYVLGELLITPPDFSHLWNQFIEISLPLLPRTLAKFIGGKTPDALILATLGEVVLGIWMVIFAFTTVFQLFSKPFSQMLIPKISSRVKSGQPLDRLVEKYYKTMILLSAPLVIGGWLVGPELIHYIFGEGYVISPETFGIFLLAFGLQTVDTLGGAMFIGTGESRRETIRFVFSILIRLTFVIFGTIVFQSLLLIGVGYVLENIVRLYISLRYQRSIISLSVPSVWESTRFLISLLLMGVVVTVAEPFIVDRLSLLSLIVAGSTIYFVSIFFSGLLSEDDIGLIIKFIGQP